MFAFAISKQAPDDKGKVILCTHLKLLPGERGVIINVASVAAYEGQIGQVAYSASKVRKF